MKHTLTRYVPFLCAVIIACLAVAALADTIVLKDGKVLQGTFMGGSETAIKFEVNGVVQEIAVSEITSLTFSPRAAQAAVGAAAAPAAAGVAGTIPAGTKLSLRTKEAISTATHQKGSKFTSVLEVDLVVSGKVMAPKGTTVYGTVLESVGGRRVGTQRIVVTFTELSVNNQTVAIVTDDVGAEGGRGGAARTVGAGALIGAAAGDAGAGAAVGGALALLAGGNHIQVPANTLVEVSLKQAVTVP